MNSKVKYLLLLLGIIAFYFSFSGFNTNFWDMLISSLSYQPLIIILLLITIFNVINIISKQNTNYLVLCRFNNLKEYYKSLVKSILKENFYTITLFILLVLSASFIGSNQNFKLLLDFSIVIYYFLKFFLLINIISILICIIYLNFKEKGTVIFTIIMLISTIPCDSLKTITISNLKQYPFKLIDYLTYLHYDTILHDILSYLLYISILLVIISLFKYLFFNKRKDLI